MITDERLQSFQTTVAGLLGQATALTNTPLGPAAALGFAAETVFRLVRLGYAIRRAQLAANKKLDEAVRLQDIPREAIPLDLTELVVRDKIRSGEFEAQFPEAAGQFRPEIEQVRNQPLWSVPKRVQRLLAFALRHVPALVRDGQLESEELQRLFGRWLHPAAPNYRRLIGEMEQLLPSPELDADSHLRRTREAFERALELCGVTLNELTEAEQQKVKETIAGLVTDAVMGPEGQANKTMSFLINLKKIQTDEELKHCQDPARIEQLKAWTARLG